MLYPMINYSSGFCLFTELNGVWIFESYDVFASWFYYNHHIYKIRDPVEAGIYFNSRTFRFEIDEEKLRHFLERAMKRETWKFMELGWYWKSLEDYEGKAWDFVYGISRLDRWEDISGFIEVVKKWLTGRGGKPIFDLGGGDRHISRGAL